MGMDIYGRKCDAEVGHYFCANVARWEKLWPYCVSVSPEAASLGEKAYYNDGDGLDAESAKKLAATLREQLASGATKAANVWGLEDHVRKFAEFLEHSGGFKIW